MKTILPLFLLPISFLISSPAFPQVNCTTYLGGVTSCTGAGGYQAEGRQYLGGVESWYDNKGGTATVRHGAFGTTTIDVAPGRAPLGIGVPPQSSTTLGVGSRHNEYYVPPSVEQAAEYGKLPETQSEFQNEWLIIQAWKQKQLSQGR
jgi:hypothetical protein